MRRRLHAWLLALVFVGGGFVLPGADIALYHLGVPHPEAETRYQADGTPLPHALECVVANQATGRALTPTVTPPTQLDFSLISRRPHVVLLLLSHEPSTLSQPRAPPAASA
jgi:hypothetical protein